MSWTEEEYPGRVRDIGVGVAYQHIFWRGLCSAIHADPTAILTGCRRAQLSSFTDAGRSAWTRCCRVIRLSDAWPATVHTTAAPAWDSHRVNHVPGQV